MQIADVQLNECMKMVTSVLAPYDGYAQTAPSHRQRLTWKLSRRTLRQLRPTGKSDKHLISTRNARNDINKKNVKISTNRKIDECVTNDRGESPIWSSSETEPTIAAESPQDSTDDAQRLVIATAALPHQRRLGVVLRQLRAQSSSISVPFPLRSRRRKSFDRLAAVLSRVFSLCVQFQRF